MSKLWYQEPAGDWNHALPLGNGSMGAMCFGGTIQDRWSLNDDTIYSGGFMDRVNPDAREGIEAVRRLLSEGRLAEAEELAEEAVMGVPEGERAYEPLCELVAQFKTPRPHAVSQSHSGSLAGRTGHAGLRAGRGCFRLPPQSGSGPRHSPCDLHTG